ncbi:MAG: PIG-L family deacetylase [Calditrichia bacterium]
MFQNDQQIVNVLAFGAHPDDVELGYGGTLHALSSQNAKIGIVDLTEGEMGTRYRLTNGGSWCRCRNSERKISG